jgi:hypothetical protein
MAEIDNRQEENSAVGGSSKSESGPQTGKRSGALTAWLWFAAVTVVIGVVMLYPIGRPVWNVVFILVKIGMMVGILLFMKEQTRGRFCVWAVSSGLAVIMSLIKWNLNGAFEWTYVLAMATDIVVPAVGWILHKKSASSGS